MFLKNLKNYLIGSVVATAGALSMFATPQIAFGEEKQYFPIASSRVGPYSAMGTGYSVSYTHLTLPTNREV